MLYDDLHSCKTTLFIHVIFFVDYLHYYELPHMYYLITTYSAQCYNSHCDGHINIVKISALDVNKQSIYLSIYHLIASKLNNLSTYGVNVGIL